jgi:hypothetical protein
MSTRETGHGLHLMAAHRSLKKQIEEIELAAVHGRSASGAGQISTPLPAEVWSSLNEALDRIESSALEIARRHNPERYREAETRLAVEATARRVFMLLNRLEETLEDLDPAALTRKFGPFRIEGELEQMSGEAARMRADLAHAIATLEQWRAQRAAEKTS